MPEVKFAQRVVRVDTSAVDEILSMMTDSTMISFAAGSPSKEAFPVQFIQESISKALTEVPNVVLSYGKSEGYLPLRELYVEHMLKPRGIQADVGNVIITTGGTQGIEMAIETFMEEGDTMLVESPTYLAAINAFQKVGANLVSVETDDYGMIMEDLEEKMKKFHPKMLYCIPTFQNPTGRELPVERRKKIAELAAKYNVIVLEDDPYGRLRYSGEPLYPIKAYDTTGHVILLDSFSKILSPGLRVGVVICDKAYYDRMMVSKQLNDTHSTTISQYVCAEFLRNNMEITHVKSVLPIYIAHLNAMMDAMDKYFPTECHYLRPNGGLFVWVKLPNGINANKLLTRCAARHVGFVPGAPFFAFAGEGQDTMRMNFSSETLENIEKGIRIIGEEIRAMM